MPRRESRGHRLPAGGYREHRLAIWGVTGCVAVAAGVALTAGLAAASPHLGTVPGSTDSRPALVGLPTVHVTHRDTPSPAPPDPATATRPTVTEAASAPTSGSASGAPSAPSATATATASHRPRPEISPSRH